MINNKKEYVLHYEDIHPILEVKNFIDSETAHQIIEFLDLNDLNNDECWGAICFRKYWAKQHPERAKELPIFSKESDELLLDSLNQKIGEEVGNFLKLGPDEFEFSKFKGHKHITHSYTPKHGFDPGLAACILPLNDNYIGGEFFIDSPSIKMRLNARSLYIFKEGSLIEHGVKEITSGTRLSLVSHWQRAGHPYKYAGANN